jgi:hypothetical protein
MKPSPTFIGERSQELALAICLIDSMTSAKCFFD